VADAILDTSAILAEVHGEPGRDVVRATLSASATSAVNFAELISHLIEWGMPLAQAADVVDLLRVEVLDADRPRALAAGALHASARRRGLSLGDSFCIALAVELGAPVLTADRRWAEIDLGVEVRLIR
jgi:ribonuclease VapC